MLTRCQQAPCDRPPLYAVRVLKGLPVRLKLCTGHALEVRQGMTSAVIVRLHPCRVPRHHRA